LEEPLAHERRVRRKAGLARDLLGRGGAQEIERQLDAGPAARDVVLQEREDSLVPKVDLARQRQQDDVDLEGAERERTREPRERRLRRSLIRRGCGGRRPEKRRTRLAREEVARVQRTDVQALEGIRDRVRAEYGAGAINRGFEDAIEALQSLQQLV